MTVKEIWSPGSFTKHFSWRKGFGLEQLYDSIRLGFDNKLENVSRKDFQDRVFDNGRPEYIPTNFFLFNRPVEGEDTIIVDELVFQAITDEHTASFDKLALFAFNFSYVGKFKRASPAQRRPALWAHHYVRDRVARDMNWDTRRVSADDIEAFIASDDRYKAEGTRKLATNLNNLYKVERLSEFAVGHVERWWVNALFLALDRLIADRSLDGNETPSGQYAALLDGLGFFDIAGKRSLEKTLATRHLVRLYDACGGRGRFSREAVLALTEAKLQDVEDFIAPNDDDPSAAIHPTNIGILKTIPAACTMLAVYAGFDVISALELREFDPMEFVKRQTREALGRLAVEQVRPTMSAEEVLRLTRGR